MPMASDGSHGPKPWQKVKVSTPFVRVPHAEWNAVKLGYKREFRTNTSVSLFAVQTPTIVVAYAIDTLGRYEAKLMVLEELWQEPLGAISPESLTAEGFATLAEFRKHWMSREHRRFRPTRNIFVYRVRLADADDLVEQGQRLVELIYGEFLPEMGATA